MPLPSLSHLQYFVIDFIKEVECPGREIREAIYTIGERATGPAFYQLMGRMEGAGLVSGRYDRIVIDGQVHRERWYRATDAGLAGWKESRDFYSLYGKKRMKPSFIDLSGQTFGRLKVLGISQKKDSRNVRYWTCRCECGKQFETTGRALRDGKTRSCGCLGRENRIKANTRHGKHLTTEYRIWISMKMRCYSPKCTHYDRYGGRGIKVCQRWLDSFDAFLEDMGPRPSPAHSIDRYPDQDGDYEPGNCRWATMAKQNRNYSRNRYLTYEGRTLLVVEWEERLGFPKGTLNQRLNTLGWPVEKALGTPHRARSGHRGKPVTSG